MLLHKEGRGPLIGFAITIIGLNALIALFAGTISYVFLALSVIFYLLVVNFFRYEPRKHSNGPLEIVCPADGRVVVVEETEEKELLGCRCLQSLPLGSPTEEQHGQRTLGRHHPYGGGRSCPRSPDCWSYCAPYRHLSRGRTARRHQPKSRLHQVRLACRPLPPLRYAGARQGWSEGAGEYHGHRYAPTLSRRSLHAL